MAESTGNRWSFQDDCSFDPRTSAGRYQAQMKGTAVQQTAPDTASHNGPNDPAASSIQTAAQRVAWSIRSQIIPDISRKSSGQKWWQYLIWRKISLIHNIHTNVLPSSAEHQYWISHNYTKD